MGQLNPKTRIKTKISDELEASRIKYVLPLRESYTAIAYPKVKAFWRIKADLL